MKSATPGAEMIGSWCVLFGNQDQVISLWRYSGYGEVDSHIRALSSDATVKEAENAVSKLCSRRRNVLTRPFSYWGEPKARSPSHIYDLRTYVLRVRVTLPQCRRTHLLQPGTMIEWANAWANGITYRRANQQDVGGWFAQVGQLYMVLI